MNRYIDFVLRRPIAVLIFLALITVILTPGMARLQFDNAIEAFMPKNDYEYVFYNDVKNVYGDNGRFVIMAVSHDDLWNPDTFGKIDDLLTDLEEYKDFDENREQSRLAGFDSIMSRGKIGYDTLISNFSGDPAFTRHIKRKSKMLFGDVEELDRGDLKKLKKEIVRTIDFKRNEIIDEIISPLTMKDITGENDTLEAYDLIKEDDNGQRILPSTAEEMDEFRLKLKRNPAFEMGLYSKDADTGEINDFCLIVRFINVADQDPIAREIKDVIDSHKDLTIITTGIPVINIGFHNYMHRDLFTLVPLVMLVVVFVFYFNFRSVRGILLPFTTLSIAQLWILGLMGYLGHKITSVDMSLPPLMIAVGSSYSIHILNQYYADFKTITASGKRTGLHISMSHISLTVLLAGLTTFVAFMTLTTSQISAIRNWGFYSAIGVMFAVFISSSLIPAALSLLPNTIPSMLLGKDKTMKTTIVDRIIAVTTKGAIVHYKWVLAVVAILIFFSVIGIFRLKVETVFLNYLKEHDSIRADANFMSDKFGGFESFCILLNSGNEDGVKDAEFLTAMENFRNWMSAEENMDLYIGRTDSFSDFIKTMHMAMNNDDKSFYAIPENQSDIIDYLEIYSGDDDDSDGRFDEFEAFVNSDYSISNLHARLLQIKGHSVGTTEAKLISERMASYLDKNLPENCSFTITGFPMMEIKLVHYIVTGQLMSLFLCLIVVGIVVILLFNQLKAGPIALVPMSVAVIINFGIMGWLGINLDMVTSLIAAITIGIGVDDTIHFLNTFRHNRARGLDVDESITRTLAVAGKAIFFTSLALVLGFTVFSLSSFIPVILFGLLMAMTMVATTIGALIVLPSVIKATAVDLKAVGAESWLSRYVNIGRLFGLEEKD
jgi:predicted RND superfamily exporter protein